jgi:hypothetical protein
MVARLKWESTTEAKDKNVNWKKKQLEGINAI